MNYGYNDLILDMKYDPLEEDMETMLSDFKQEEIDLIRKEKPTKKELEAIEYGRLN